MPRARPAAATYARAASSSPGGSRVRQARPLVLPPPHRRCGRLAGAARRGRGGGRARRRAADLRRVRAVPRDTSPAQVEGLIGLAFAIVILILAFGSVLAMGLPIGVALAGIGVGTILTVPAVQRGHDARLHLTLGIMIGLGVGIDYALFIVTRYREHLHRGHEHRASRPPSRHRHRRPGRALRRHHRGDLPARHARDGREFVQGLAIGAAVVVAGHHGRLGHPAARPARLRRRAGRGHPLAGPHRRRAGGDRPRRAWASDRPAAARPARWPSWCWPPASPWRRSSGRSPAGRRSPCARRSRTAGAASSSVDPWPAAIGGAGLLAAARRARSSPAPRLLRRGQLRRGHHHPQGLRPARRGLRARLQRPAAPGLPSSPNGTDLPAARGPSPRRSPADPGVAFASPAIPNDPAAPTAAIWRVIPTTHRRTRPPPSSCRPAAQRGAPAATAGRRRRGGHRQRGGQRRLLRLPRPPGCPTSSAPCSPCRSCC
jgi:putative drug exporter of the RND superfamily